METYVFLFFLALLTINSEASVNPRYESLLPVDERGPNSKGTEFYVGFLKNLHTEVTSVPIYQIMVSTDEPETVTFTVTLDPTLPQAMRQGFPLTSSVSYGEVVTVRFHQDIFVRSTSVRNKAIHVRTEGGKKVTVQGFVDDLHTSDGFVALPCEAMRSPFNGRLEYFVMSADQKPSQSDPSTSSQILIIPCEDSTEITLHPTQIVTLIALRNLPQPPDRRQVGPGGKTTFIANSGQTILIIHSEDLTGSIIQASKPISVFSGHECAEVPLDVTACDYVIEQMPPTTTFGYTFFLVPLAVRESGDMFRVGTVDDRTEVTVTCVTSPGDSPARLTLDNGGRINRGEYISFMTPGRTNNQQIYRQSYCCLDASEPVIVAQYSTGHYSDATRPGKPNPEIGDPFMTLIAPVTSFLNNYTIMSLVGDAGPFPFRYMNLMISSNFFDNSEQSRNQVKLNGTAVTPMDGWLPFYCSNNRTCGYGAQVEVPRGIINVYHEQPNVGLGLSYYAFQQQNSYGLPVAYELTPLAATRAILRNITVPEDVGNVTISVTRKGDLGLHSQGTLTPRPTTSGKAQAGSDYVDFAPVTLDYAGSNRDSVFEFQITIVDDDVQEPTESFEINSTAIKNLYFPIPVMTVTILDNDAPIIPEVYFDPTSYTVNEADRTVTLTIQSSKGHSIPNGTVEFYTEDGTASAREDYTQRSSIPVVFAPGETSTTVTVPLINDNAVESPETFFGRLRSTGTGSVSITQDRANVTIISEDVEMATISFSSSSYSVNESAGVVSITVDKTGTFSQPIHGLVTTLNNGSASPSSDFTGKKYPFTISPSEEHAFITIPITDDTTVEKLLEQFPVILSIQPQPGLHLDDSQASVTIVDDDDIVVSLEPSTQTVAEGSYARFKIVTTGQSDVPFSVHFRTQSGSANAPGDYQVSSITLNKDQLSSGEFEVTVQVKNDTVLEGQETFQGVLQLTQESLNLGVVRLGQRTGEVDITDDDSVGIGFVPSVYSVDEDAGVVTFTVQNRNPDLEREVTVQFTTTDGTASSNGNDYVPTSQAVTFAPGDTIKRVQVPINNDDVYEGLEEFTAQLTTTDSGVAIFQPDATARIRDDDEISVQFDPTSYTVTEGGDIELVVTKVGDAEEEVTVTLSTQDGTAGSSDYTGQSVQVTFAPDETEKRVTIQTATDNVFEGTEKFTAVLTSSSDRVTITEDTADVSIIEKGRVIVEFQPSSYTVVEGEGMVRFAIVKRTLTTEDVTVQFTTHEGSATSAEDFSSTTQEVTFSVKENVKYVTVPITIDSVLEGAEQFTATLSPVQGSIDVEIRQENATATIVDDDEISVQFNPTSYTVAEGGNIELVVTKTGTADEEVTVTLTTQDGSAGNSDYTGKTVQLTFAPGETNKRVTIQTTADNVLEGTEKLSAVLTSPSDRVTITEDTADISIVESGSVLVEFDPTSYTVNEEDRVVLFTIVKRTPTTQPVTVQFTTQDGSATSPGDYTSVSKVVTFNGTESKKVVEVALQDDSAVEPKEQFTATLSPVVGPIGVQIGEGDATATIIDGDSTVISFSSPTLTVPEDGGPLVVCLNKSAPTTEDFSVQVVARETQPSDATGGSDFISGPVTVSFPAGPAGQACADVPIIDDSVALEEGEKFELVITPPNIPGVTSDGISVTVDIIDDDVVGVFFESVSTQIPENGGPAIVCLRRNQSVAKNFSVQVSTANLSPAQATADSDYQQAEFTVTFGVDNDRVCLEVPILDDQMNEGTEKFEVLITGTPPGVSVAQPERTVVSIVDDDVVTVDFSSPSYSVPEQGGPAQICLSTNRGSDKPLTVNIIASPITASAGQDYSTVVQQVTIPASTGPSKVCFNINITDDSISEGNEDFLVSFQLPPNSDAVPGPTSSTTVTIVDDDVPIVEFVTPEVTVPEDVGDVDVCLRINGSISSPVTVQLFATPLTAEAGLDYVPGISNLAVFQPAGNSVVCTSFEIIDDLLALEEDEKFIIDTAPEEGEFEIGDNNQTVVTIKDNDVVTIEPSSESTVVNEKDGTVRICLMKDKNTTKPFSVVVNPQTSGSNTSATPNVDFKTAQGTVTFNPLDRESCTKLEIISDVTKEVPEDFHVSYSATIENVDDKIVVSPKVTKVTIIDSEIAGVANDTVIGDPLFTVPITKDEELCFEIHGKPRRIYNFVSDKCTTVSAAYVPMDIPGNGNIVQSVGVRAVGANNTCHNIEVRLKSSGDGVEALLDGIAVNRALQIDGIRVNKHFDRVRISVPNCEYQDLVMWAMYQKINGQKMLKYVITRGYNLAPTSHGLLGQFWNIPVLVKPFSGVVNAVHRPDFANRTVYRITLTPATGGKQRSFLGQWHEIAWDRKSGPCYYVGNSEGGKSGELNDNQSVIEGKYSDYEMNGLFEYNFIYSQFEANRCN